MRLRADGTVHAARTFCRNQHLNVEMLQLAKIFSSQFENKIQTFFFAASARRSTPGSERPATFFKKQNKIHQENNLTSDNYWTINRKELKGKHHSISSVKKGDILNKKPDDAPQNQARNRACLEGGRAGKALPQDFHLFSPMPKLLNTTFQHYIARISGGCKQAVCKLRGFQGSRVILY